MNYQISSKKPMVHNINSRYIANYDYNDISAIDDDFLPPINFVGDVQMFQPFLTKVARQISELGSMNTATGIRSKTTLLPFASLINTFAVHSIDHFGQFGRANNLAAHAISHERFCDLQQ